MIYDISCGTNNNQEYCTEIYGNGDYRYTLVENWVELPDDMTLLDVCSICIDKEDRVYLITRGTYPVVVCDRDGHQLYKWGQGMFGHIHGGRIGPDDSIYCTDADGHTVSKHNKFTGEMIFQLGTKGKPTETGFVMLPDLEAALDAIREAGPPFNYPTNMFLSRTGEIYVSDGYGNARIHKFSADGKLLQSWGEPGREPGQFRVVHSVWIDKHERIWVTDRHNNRLQIFGKDMNFLDQWIGLDLPCDIFIDDDEIVYVAELGRRVSIFDKNGKLLSRIRCTEHDKEKALLLGPHGIAVDSKGDIYIGEVAKTMAQVDRRARVVQKFARVR